MGRLTPLTVADGQARILASMRLITVQSADPVDLQAKAQAVMDALILAGADFIVDAEIEGASDGHTFIVSFLVVEGPGAPAAGTLVRIWMGANREVIGDGFNAILAEVSGIGVYHVAGFGIAGAGQGTRFCGMALFVPPQG